jgi:hypothetical protein
MAPAACERARASKARGAASGIPGGIPGGTVRAGGPVVRRFSALFAVLNTGVCAGTAAYFNS